MNNAVASKQEDGGQSVADQAGDCRLVLGSGSFEVEWDAEAKVTPMGSLVYFAQFLHGGGLLDRLCAGAPLGYSSPNAPRVRDLMGTVVLSVLNGQTRYAHVNGLRGDRVSAELLGLSKVVSEDSVRRALGRGDARAWEDWLLGQERATWEPLLAEPYVLDIDNTVKPLYGHQEGAELGYNPRKPGRPSHNYHTYFIGSLRLVLGVEVAAGKRHGGTCGLPGLWRLLDRLPKARRPWLVRGDAGYGSEECMLEAEGRDQAYLFKLRQTRRVQDWIGRAERDARLWGDAGEGWQGTETRLQLAGWSRPRRCVLLRRPGRPPTSRPALPARANAEFSFVEQVPSGPDYQYIVLVTNVDLPVASLGQLYRDRADCENVFDEIKNQWGWAGFVTRDMHRCAVMARLIALIYNWWNIFVRLAQPDRHLEAVTSRPLLLYAVGRMVSTARRKIIRLTSTHGLSERIRTVLDRVGRFLSRLALTAEQLGVEVAWALILSAAFIKWLRGKILYPVANGDQMLLSLMG